MTKHVLPTTSTAGVYRCLNCGFIVVPFTADEDCLDTVDIVASDEQDRVEEDTAYWEHYGFGAVEQGFYDDDPSPYDGNYSEM